MKKRGQQIISIMLIILVSILTLIILSNIFTPMIKSKSKNIEQNVERLRYSHFSIKNWELNKDKTISVEVKRETGGGNFKGLIFILDTKKGKCIKKLKGVEIKELETKTFTVPIEECERIENVEEVIGDVESCTANWKCEEWSECKEIYDFTNIIKNNLQLKQQKARKCIDLNKCYFDKTEVEECTTENQATFKKIIKQSGNYLEVYNSKNIMVSRLELTNEKFQKLNIQIFFDNAHYYPHCYDNIKNFGEDGIDCVNNDNGICPKCRNS